MNPLIKQLQECSTIGQADPILTRLGASLSVKKLVETSIILSNSPDQQQRNHAFSFMETAIRELEDDQFRNHNNGQRERGGHGSSDNVQPYPNPATYSPDGEHSMLHMADSMNQWNETFKKITTQELQSYYLNNVKPNADKLNEMIESQRKYGSKMFREIQENQKRINQLRNGIKHLKSNAGDMGYGIQSLVVETQHTITETNANPEDYGFYAPVMGIIDHNVQETTNRSNGGYNGAPILGIERHQDHYPTETARRQNLELNRILNKE